MLFLFKIFTNNKTQTLINYSIWQITFPFLMMLFLTIVFSAVISPSDRLTVYSCGFSKQRASTKGLQVPALLFLLFSLSFGIHI
jgi:hypothetical protein